MPDQRSADDTSDQLWPENLWRAGTSTSSEVVAPTEEDILASLPLADFPTPTRQPRSNLVPLYYKGKLTKFRDLDAALLNFFSRLAALVDAGVPEKLIFQHFYWAPWVNNQVTYAFGEEEWELLNRTVAVLAVRDFRAGGRHPPEQSATIGILDVYVTRGLLQPRHWATSLITAATAMSNDLHTAHASVRPKWAFDAALAFSAKNTHLIGLWQLFLTQHKAPIDGSMHSTIPQDSDRIGHVNRNMQDAFFDLLPLWQRGADSASDQNVLGAFVLTLTYYTHTNPVLAASQSPSEAQSRAESNPSYGFATSDKQDAAHQRSTSSQTSVPTPIEHFVKAMGSFPINAIWVRLLLAKISLPGSRVLTILSDLRQAMEEARKGEFEARNPARQVLSLRAKELAVWLRTARSDESQRTSVWLRDRSALVAPNLMDLMQRAAIVPQLRDGRYSVARRILRMCDQANCRSIYSTLLRKLYYAGDRWTFWRVWGTVTDKVAANTWTHVPRAWQLYRLRQLLRQDPARAFESMWLFGQEATEKTTSETHGRLVRSLMLTACRLFGRIPGPLSAFEDAFLTSEGVTNDPRHLACLMAMRYAICTEAYQDFWISTYQANFTDREPLRSACRLMFQRSLLSGNRLGVREITALFSAALPLGDPDVFNVDVLSRLHTAARLGTHKEHSIESWYMTEIMEIGVHFHLLIQQSEREDRVQILVGLEEYFNKLISVMGEDAGHMCKKFLKDLKRSREALNFPGSRRVLITSTDQCLPEPSKRHGQANKATGRLARQPKKDSNRPPGART